MEKRLTSKHRGVRGGPGATHWLAVLLLVITPVRVYGEKDPYMELSLTDLLDVQVTSVSRKEQRLAKAASAVHVITREDIRRSGATSIPEILRMVPGVNVARIDANKWAISARGQNGLWANKLLVLLDGRSIYTPLFAGVWWDVQNPMLEDIERIEVIRGPGATLWGANAVNGVINIITRSAQETQGGLLSAGYGSEKPGFGAVRYGGALGEAGHYRVYAKAFRRDDSQLATGDEAWDGGHQGSTGFRTDWAGGRDEITLQGDAYTGMNRRVTSVDSLTPPHSSTVDDEEDLSGGNLTTRWTRTLSESSAFSLQAWYDHSERDSLLIDELRDTFDLDFQHRFAAGLSHEIVWGLGLRYTRDDIRGSRVAGVAVRSRNDRLFSGFLQDEIQLLPDRLSLTLGSKIEHNDYTGTELQPSARLLWTPDGRQSLWAAVSRAVRTPSRWEDDARMVNTSSGYPLPTVITFNGSRDMVSEELIAYEAGYRIQVAPNLSLDAALFYNDYSKLRGIAAGTSSCQPSGTPPPCFVPGDSYFLLPFTFDNSLAGESWGLELNADWRPRDDLRLVAAYGFLEADFHSANGYQGDELAADTAPRHQLSLRAQLDPTANTELDLWLRYVADLPSQEVDAYLTADLRLAWRPRPRLELSLVGRNLLQPSHLEFVELQENLDLAEVERSVHVQAVWHF